MIAIQPYVVGALVRHFGFRRTALSAALMDVPEDAGYAAQVASWYESLPARERLGMGELRLLAAPDLLADIRVLRGDRSLVRFLLIAAARPGGAQCLLAGPKEDGRLEIQPLAGLDVLSDTLLGWLAATGEPAEPHCRIRLGWAELALLLGWIDLETRACWSAALSHQPYPEAYPVEDIASALAGAERHEDPRWILNFLRPLLPAGCAPREAQTVFEALRSLDALGLAQPQGSAWKWTRVGEFLATSFRRRTAVIAVDTAAAAPGGDIGRHAACFLRGDEPLWLLDLPPEGGPALAGISLFGARRALDALLTPAATAPDWSPAASQDAAASGAAGRPPGAEPARPDAGVSAGEAPRAACPACGRKLPARAKFCGYCGVPLPV